MITNSREQKICDKYSADDETGHVRCNECPLRKSHGNYDFRCKANSHYNRSIRDWEYDNLLIKISQTLVIKIGLS